jgi:hypothetical protein
LLLHWPFPLIVLKIIEKSQAEKIQYNKFQTFLYLQDLRRIFRIYSVQFHAKLGTEVPTIGGGYEGHVRSCSQLASAVVKKAVSIRIHLGES